jgi:hypothetical protein
MPVPKGTRVGGRKKGKPNKATATAREAIARFVDHNSTRLQGWLDQIAADDPMVAFNCVRDLIEYHVPKLQRTDINANVQTKSEMLVQVGFVPGKDGERGS